MICSTKEDSFTVEEVYCMAKDHYGSVYNLFGMGGPGTYILLGPTEAGKSFFLKQLYFYAISPLCEDKYRLDFNPVIVLSTTSKINAEYNFSQRIIKLKPSNEAIDKILAERKKEMKENCIDKKLREKWAEDHPMMIALDDTYGAVNYSVPNNSVAKLATKARHYGIWLVVNVQYIKQVGPIFHDNARMWITFSINTMNHRFIIQKHHGNHKQLIKICASWTRKAYHPIVYVTTWRFRSEFGVLANRVLKLYPVEPLKESFISFDDDSEDGSSDFSESGSSSSSSSSDSDSD